MTPEEVKIKLEGIKWLDKEIQGLQLELQYLDEGLFKKTTITQTKVQSSRINNTENKIVNTIELKKDIEKRIELTITSRLERSKLIDKISNPLERTVLRMFYLNYLDVWDVANRIDKSEASVYRIKKVAIENIAKVMSDEVT